MKFDPALVGVVHLPPLPGSSAAHGDCAGALQRAGELAILQSKTLEKAGFHALILENYLDSPFHKDALAYETVCAMTLLAAAVKEVVRIPIGINLLRNASLAAQAAAAVSGCEFIRVNVLSGVYATDQGIIEGKAAELGHHRASLFGKKVNGENALQWWADVRVKHASPLLKISIAHEMKNLVQRCGAQALIITGKATGEAVNEKTLLAASRTSSELGVPLFIGSGVVAEDMNYLLQSADGVIVGSSIRKNRTAGEALDASAIKKVVRAFEQATNSKKKKRAARQKSKA